MEKINASDEVKVQTTQDCIEFMENWGAFMDLLYVGFAEYREHKTHEEDPLLEKVFTNGVEAFAESMDQLREAFDKLIEPFGGKLLQGPLSTIETLRTLLKEED